LTFGTNGPKFWPAGPLRRSAESLVGAPLTKNHDDERVESVIGEVVDAAFEDGVGVVYEAEVDDFDIAQKIARGRLEVSIHAAHGADGRTDDGAMIVEDITFLDLSVVPRGAAASNTIQTGSSPTQALASLSATEVATMLESAVAGEPANDAGSQGNGGTTAVAEGGPQSPGGPSGTAEATDGPDGADSTGSLTTMTDTETDSPDEADIEADAEAEAGAQPDEGEGVKEAEADAQPDEGVEEEAEAEADADADADDTDEAELQEELAELRRENIELREELEAVRMEYAEQLAEDAPFEAEELAETFSFETLQERFEEHRASLAEATGVDTESQPAPQTGDVSDDEELSTSEDDDEAEIATLEAQISKYEELGWGRAKAEAEATLAELRD
jgi:hypothetical protein